MGIILLLANTLERTGPTVELLFHEAEELFRHLELLMMPGHAWVKLGWSLTLAVLGIIFFNPMTKVL